MGICRGAGDRVAPDPGGIAGYGRKGAGCVEMGESFSVADTAAAGAPELSDPVVQPTRGPPPGRAADGPESTPGPTGDHACVAGALDDVVRRLFSAGLALEAVLGQIGEYRAAGPVQHAVSELDQAITGITDMAFRFRRPNVPANGWPG